MQVQEASRAVFRRNWDAHVASQRDAVEAAAPLIARAARLLGGPGVPVIGVVPRQDRPLVPLEPERRAEFAARLDEILAKAFDGPVPPMDLGRRVRDEAEEHPLVGASCALCQGSCCSIGGRQLAFLDVDDMRRYRLRHPEATAAELRAHYLGRIPDRSVEHSCIFQSATGCTLDRSDRADVCNRYHCNPQSQFMQRLREAGSARAVIVAHERDMEPAVAAFDPAGGLRHVAAAPEGAGAEILDSGGPDIAEALAAVDAALAQLPVPLPGGLAEAEAGSCRFCGGPLTPHERVTTRCCAAPACVARWAERLRLDAAERREKAYTDWRERALAAAAGALAAAAVRLGSEPGALLAGVVPYQGKVPEPLPAERRAEFEAHLDGIVAEGFAGPAPDADPERPAIDAPEAPLLSACCATCQGACCTAGAREMAFLRATDMGRFRQRNPGATAAEVRAFYLARLPERSVPGACVYLSATGCTLPRACRASICNTFHCRGQRDISAEWHARGARAAVIVAHRDSSVAPGEGLGAVALFRAEEGCEPLAALNADDKV